MVGLIERPGNIVIYQDNKSCIVMSSNKYALLKGRSRYIDRKYFLVCDKVDHKRVNVKWIDGHNMIADVHTKDIGGEKFKSCIRKLLGCKREENIIYHASS